MFIPGGRREDTCEQGLSRTPLTVNKTFHELTWKVKMMFKKKLKTHGAYQLPGNPSGFQTEKKQSVENSDDTYSVGHTMAEAGSVCLK